MRFRTYKVTEGEKIDVWVEANGRAETSPDGALLKLFGTCQDITEQMKLQDELIQSSRLSSIGLLAAGIGHEINNPLTISNGYISRLIKQIDGGSLPPEFVRGLAHKLLDANRRIKEIVDGIRIYARTDKNEKEITSIGEPLVDNIVMLQNLYAKEGVQLELHLSGDPIFTKIPIGKFQQIITNLVNNAKDATLGKKNRRVQISLRSEGQYAILEVEDNGSGINEAVKDKIFDTFFTTKEAGEGTGLGLSIVRKILLEHGARIHFETKTGVGTKFIVEFPIVSADVSKISDKDTSLQKEHFLPKNRGQQLKALVVDDEPELRELLAELLEDLGCTVATASNGKEALSLLMKEGANFNYLLTDLNMPEMNGFDLIKAIREKSQFDSIAIVAITGGIAEQFDKDTNSELNELADFCVMKPYDESEIQRILNTKQKKPA